LQNYTKKNKKNSLNQKKIKTKTIFCFLFLLSLTSYSLQLQANTFSLPVVIKSKINDSTVSVMEITKSGDTTYINSYLQTSSIIDSYLCYIDTNISFTDYKITIPSNQGKYWMIPFDGSNPIQIANIGGGTSSVCYKYYCTCLDDKICANNCGNLSTVLLVNDKYVVACEGRKIDAPCPTCGVKPCKVICNTNASLGPAINESYVTKSGVIILNNTLYE
jgi:hypothetical protein